MGLLAMLAMMSLLALTAPDIAMFIINMQNECTLGREDGKSQYVSFDLSTWMYCASAIHFTMMTLIACMPVAALVDVTIGDRCDTNCQCAIAIIAPTPYIYIFLFAWTVVGFLLQEEVRNHGVNHQQCGDILLGWLIVQMCTYILPWVCACLNSFLASR